MIAPMAVPGVKVAVFADTDSRWKWGVSTARSMQPTATTLFGKSGHAVPTGRQLVEAGVDPAAVTWVTMGEFPQALATAECDVVVLALSGDACQAALHALARVDWPGRRPITVSGYVGIVYEGFTDGALLRAGSDVVLANSPKDAARFRRLFGEQGIDPDTVVESALPFLTSSPAVPQSSSDAPFTLTFAAQPDVPATRAERRYVVERLAAHALRYPERKVVLKVRGLPGEQLTHPEPYPYHRLVTRLGDSRPANLEVVAGPMSEVLARTSLLVTVSSTAAAEAVHQRIPTAILTDFGIREKLGNTFFCGSGCMASFDEIDAGVIPRADAGWAHANGFIDAREGGFRSRVDALLAQPMPPISPYFTLARSPSYVPWLLANHGLAPDGGPLAQPRLQSHLRRGIRSASHLLYRKGASVVAPALRKAGSI